MHLILNFGIANEQIIGAFLIVKNTFTLLVLCPILRAAESQVERLPLEPHKKEVILPEISTQIPPKTAGQFSRQAQKKNSGVCRTPPRHRIRAANC
ncbi:MAG TPA: hypothetical protein DE060_09700 [Lentisphaeria bacterium]|nr:hypothetical protein [Lentisphaeria bacterium]HCG49460.1 hypothetical protein [Lentisphaeria bacterium]